MSGRRIAVACGAVLLLAGGARVAQVHAQDGEWALTPSAAPPTLSVGGRDYRRGGAADLLPGAVVIERTAGGGEVLGPSDRTYAPTVLQVRDGADVTTYSLVGGP